MDATPPEIRVDATTRMTSAGADWYPLRVTATGVVHWFYGPRLRNGVDSAATWCSDTLIGVHSAADLSTDLRGATPCARCSAKWSMT